MTRRLRLLSSAAKDVDARRARSTQRKIGASDVGTCRRRAGYKHHGVKPSDPGNASGLKAIHGTWIHNGALETMRREWGALIETTVENDVLRGHVDAIELPAEWREMAGLPPVDDTPDVVVVDDLKTKDDARAIDYVRMRGPRRAELYQVMLYADLLRRGEVGPLQGRVKKHEAALRQAIEQPRVVDARSTDVVGLPVEVVRLRYVPRTGQETQRDSEESVEYVHEQPFDQDIADEAWEWVRQITTSASPEDLPRDQDGPGLSIVCDNCPFVTACWGAVVDGVKPQAKLIVTDADLATALSEYDEGRTLEARGKQMKDLARAKLDATKPAVYTDGKSLAYKLTWSGGREVPAGQEPDVEKMLELYEQAGLEVPMREVPARKTTRSIGVVPWTPPDPVCGKPVGDPVPFEVDDTVWLQDRPRGGWTGSRMVDFEEVREEELTAGKFTKRFPDYVDPRPTCILKQKHSGDCSDAEHIVELETDLEEPEWGDLGA